MKGNVLGDIRAEQDQKMLETAFWETSDYKALLESYDRPIVVGRRGAGKSAIAHMLSKHWASKPKTFVLKIIPEEEQVIGLRDIFSLFGDKYLHIKAGIKLAWRYAIYMEVITEILNHYKQSKNIDVAAIRGHIATWGARRQSIATKIRKKLKSIMKEGQTLRLHWDEYNLFNLVCNRLRKAFGSSVENSTRVWNEFAARELKGKEGFRVALKLTLYRPRDILVLLNDAFLRANTQGRKHIILEDIEVTAKTISINRITDLHKEYDYIFPSLDEFTSSFHGSTPEIDIENATRKLTPVLNKDNLSRDKQQDIFLFENINQVLQRLYSVGFLGVYNEQSASFVFCHDGKDPDREFESSTRFLIHPCYWLALAVTQSELKLDEAEDINDEYDIEVTYVSSDQRNQRIEDLLKEITEIPEGSKGAHDFESWALKAIKIVFAGSICNIEIHPNKNALQQRDIVGTNLGETKFWKRIFDDYKTRQIIFEVKNFQELSAPEYRQISSYLVNDYGSFGFFITRAFNNNLQNGKELNWSKELYNDQKKVIIKLSSKFLEKHLRKARNPKKHDAADKELNSLLDTYVRRYFPNKCK